jgi:hypothetical protein
MAIKIVHKVKRRESLKDLRREVVFLRSFVIGHIGKDAEGGYRSEFVKRILAEGAGRKNEHVFKDRQSFLDYVNADTD